MKKISIVVLGLVLLAAGCNKSKPSENSQTTAPEPAAQTETNTSVGTDVSVTPPVVVAKTYEIKMTSAGFEPATLSIKKGDTVKFINSDTKAHWPASNPHPTHTIYSAFDSKGGIAAGSSWSFTFDKAGTWKFHDHLNDDAGGTITVTE